MNKDQHSEQEIWMTKFLAGEASPAEERQLKDWIAESQSNEAQFAKMKQVFAWSKKHYLPQQHQHLDIDVDREWQHFASRLEQTQGAGKTVMFDISNQWLRVAAAVVLVVVSGFVINYLLTRPADTIYQTAENAMEFSLPDGSVVTLNRNTKLTYGPQYGATTREVILQGEAFFDVVADGKIPFVVKVEETLVRVVGTSFGVQGYAGRPALEVTVVTGKVNVATKGIDQPLQLEAGEKAIYSRNSRELKKHVNKDPNFLSWKTKELIFNAAPLQEVLTAVGFTYGVEITVSTPLADSCRVTVSFSNQSLEAVLKVLQSTLDLTYRTVGKKIEIVEAGC